MKNVYKHRRRVPSMRSKNIKKQKPKETRGSNFFGLADFEAEELDEIMRMYPKTFKKLGE